jgi:cellulose synthase/poly-beta-1,6-N-acetylglucosamine synthase-like glycosyltransferase
VIALGPYAASLAPALLVLGLGIAILWVVRSDRQPLRALAAAVAIALTWRYEYWRFTETIPVSDSLVDAVAAWAFALLEACTLISATIALVILSRTRDRRPEADEHLTWWPADNPPQVDVLIATYNEEETILERTITGAMAIDYPRLRVWVLDDGRRLWLRALCARLGARYVIRDDNAHAKAGNLNNGLATLRREPDPPDFVAVLDADFVPYRDFVRRALALFHDSTVGLVQTPQHFFNQDPIQHNLGIGRGYPDEQRFFFEHVQPARDAWSIAFCCGTSSMMRWSALEAIGGIPTDSVTEDLLITLRLRQAGWGTVYLNEPLSEGLAPEGLAEYITQRARWCLGLMQIVRGPLGPLRKNALRVVDRFGLTDSWLYWASSYPFRIACLVVPLLYWFFGVTVVNAPVEDVLSYFVPYYVATVLVLNWMSSGLVMPVLNDVSQLLCAREIIAATFHGLFRPKEQKFKVTAKGGDRAQVLVQWPVMRPLLAMLVLNIAGILFSSLTDVVFDHDPGDGRSVILLWSLYNVVVLSVAVIVCVDLPRARVAPRFIPEPARLITDGHGVSAWLMRLTTEDGWLRGGPFLNVGERLDVEVCDVGRVAAEVTRVEQSGFAVALHPTREQRAALLRKLHTREARVSARRTNLGLMIGGAFRRGQRA